MIKLIMWDIKNKCLVNPDYFLGHYDDLYFKDLEKLLNDKSYAIEITCIKCIPRKIKYYCKYCQKLLFYYSMEYHRPHSMEGQKIKIIMSCDIDNYPNTLVKCKCPECNKENSFSINNETGREMIK